VAIGTIVAFTPTIGFQTLLALGLATLLNANRPVSIVPTWLTNPATIPPVYAFTYYLGSLFWGGPPPRQVAHMLLDAAKELGSLDPLAMRAQVDVFLGLGSDVFVSMWIGGLIVGVLASAVLYPLTFHLVIRLRARRRAWRTRRGRPKASPSGS